MSMVIRCPRESKPISTGIEADPESFKALPDALSRVYCPCCGLEHVWWTREAFLAEIPSGDTGELINAG